MMRNTSVRNNLKPFKKKKKLDKHVIKIRAYFVPQVVVLQMLV